MIYTAVDNLKEANKQMTKVVDGLAHGDDIMKTLERGHKDATTSLECAVYSNAIGMCKLWDKLKADGLTDDIFGDV